MKRSLAVAGMIALALVLGPSAIRASDTTPEPGGVRVMGELAEGGQYHLQVEVGAEADWFHAGAVVVRSEPSGTVLTALVDGNAQAYLLALVQAMKPQSMSVCPLFGVLGNYYQAPPPSGDNRVVVEYLVKDGEEWVPFGVADANFDDAEPFQFIATPFSGGGFKFCEYCDSTFCGCIRCSTPVYTRCCPSCYFVCGIVLCP